MKSKRFKPFIKHWMVKNTNGKDIFSFDIHCDTSGFRWFICSLNFDLELPKFPIIKFLIDKTLHWKTAEEKLERLAQRLFLEIKATKELHARFFLEEWLTIDGRYSPSLHNVLTQIQAKEPTETEIDNIKQGIGYSEWVLQHDFAFIQTHSDRLYANFDIKENLSRFEFEKIISQNLSLAFDYVEAYIYPSQDDKIDFLRILTPGFRVLIVRWKHSLDLIFVYFIEFFDC